MFTEPAAGKANGKGVRGRKDSQDMPEAPKQIPEAKLKDGEHLCRKLDEARASYNDWCTAVGKKHGVKASVVNKVVKARVADNFDDKKAEIEQLAFAFGIVDSVSAPATEETKTE